MKLEIFMRQGIHIHACLATKQICKREFILLWEIFTFGKLMKRTALKHIGSYKHFQLSRNLKD